MRTTMRWPVALWAAAYLIPLVAESAVLNVGPGRTYRTPCQAFAAARPGDTVEIDANGNYDGDVCGFNIDRLTIRGVGGRAKLDAQGRSAEGKATWVIKGDDNVVENIEFTGARAAQANGAGIRHEGIGLTIRNCYFHHNQDGILTVDRGGTILIEYSEFAFNGNQGGSAHNLYIGKIDRLIFRYNYSHDSKIGHLLKTRAAENQIYYSRFTSELGSGSYELEFPNGGLTFVVGNVIQQGENSVNNNIISYGMEGLEPTIPSTELYVVHNTIINETMIPGGNFILVGRSILDAPVVTNNLLVGPGDLSSTQNIRLNGNIWTDYPGLRNLAAIDFHLLESSPAIDQAVEAEMAPGRSLAPDRQYVHPACVAVRTSQNAPDVGAFEFGGRGQVMGPPERCTGEVPDPGIAVVDAATFASGATSPGAIVTIFTESRGLIDLAASNTPLPSKLAGVEVFVDEEPASLFYVDSTQVNAQIPPQIATGLRSLVVARNGRQGPGAAIQVARAAPRIFVYSGTERAIAQNQNWSLNSAGNPANPGEIITLYLVGQGDLDNPVAGGFAASADPLSWAVLPYSATVGSQAAEVVFLGLTPELVGVAQANIKIPDLAPGRYILIITIDGVPSNSVEIFAG